MSFTDRVLLVGNYRADQQMSMLGYHDLLLREFISRGVSVASIEPASFFGRGGIKFLTKWLRYIDKYLCFPPRLWLRVRKECLLLKAKQQLIVHITDHSNAPYVSFTQRAVTVITCHDLLAVRGALGENTDCPATGFGKLLQYSILRALCKMDRVLCVSAATEGDLHRLAPDISSEVIPLPLNRTYTILNPVEAVERLESFKPGLTNKPFVLHVGSSLQRKNREGVLRSFALIKDQWTGSLVFAGEALPQQLQSLAFSLEIADRIIELVSPPGYVLEALYNLAHCLFFPSKAEGFGWPIIEAQACGCPVLIASTTSLPEVAGTGALVRDISDERGFAVDLLRLRDPALRGELIAGGHENLKRFHIEKVLKSYFSFYETALASNSN